ncbi:LOW QUALITY PROTEIN: uncharacterized protein VK521_014349 [Ammospiza maritima maritima]
MALADWCRLLPSGTQTTQLLVEPPWMPAVLWDWVTLTCQGLGSASATTWYKVQATLWQGHNTVRVTESVNYKCDRPGSGLSLPVRVSNNWLVLQAPVKALVEGDTVKLHCRGWRNNTVTSVSFYHEEKKLQELRDGTELSLSPLQLHHSGRYSCKGWVDYWGWKESAPVPVTVTVHVAAGVGGAILFLLLLVGVIVAWHRWHCVGPPQIPHPPQRRGRSCTPTSWSPRRQGRPPVPPPSRIPSYSRGQQGALQGALPPSRGRLGLAPSPQGPWRPRVGGRRENRSLCKLTGTNRRRHHHRGLRCLSQGFWDSVAEAGAAGEGGPREQHLAMQAAQERREFHRVLKAALQERSAHPERATQGCWSPSAAGKDGVREPGPAQPALPQEHLILQQLGSLCWCQPRGCRGAQPEGPGGSGWEGLGWRDRDPTGEPQA